MMRSLRAISAAINLLVFELRQADQLVMVHIPFKTIRILSASLHIVFFRFCLLVVGSPGQQKNQLEYLISVPLSLKHYFRHKR
jgi:hypothetical protein